MNTNYNMDKLIKKSYTPNIYFENMEEWNIYKKYITINIEQFIIKNYIYSNIGEIMFIHSFGLYLKNLLIIDIKDYQIISWFYDKSNNIKINLISALQSLNLLKLPKNKKIMSKIQYAKFIYYYIIDQLFTNKNNLFVSVKRFKCKKCGMKIFSNNQKWCNNCIFKRKLIIKLTTSKKINLKTINE